MNTNVDLILSGTELFNQLNMKQIDEPKNHQILSDLHQFKECFSYFFRKGSAAERSFLNLQDFDKVIHATKNLKQQVFFL